MQFGLREIVKDLAVFLTKPAEPDDSTADCLHGTFLRRSASSPLPSSAMRYPYQNAAWRVKVQADMSVWDREFRHPGLINDR